MKKGRGGWSKEAKRVEEQTCFLGNFGQFLKIRLENGAKNLVSIFDAENAQNSGKAVKGRGGWSTLLGATLPLSFIGRIVKG